jgi:hypothetical protein
VIEYLCNLSSSSFLICLCTCLYSAREDRFHQRFTNCIQDFSPISRMHHLCFSERIYGFYACLREFSGIYEVAEIIFTFRILCLKCTYNIIVSDFSIRPSVIVYHKYSDFQVLEDIFHRIQLKLFMNLMLIAFSKLLITFVNCFQTQRGISLQTHSDSLSSPNGGTSGAICAFLFFIFW